MDTKATHKPCVCGSRRLRLQQPIHGYIVTTYEPMAEGRFAPSTREEKSARNYRQPILIVCADCLRELRAPDAEAAQTAIQKSAAETCQFPP